MDQNAVPTTAGALRQKRDELYRAAREHPGSEEDEMVEILLLSAMSNLQPVGYDAKPGMAIGEDRRRFQAARERKAQQHRDRQRAIAKARERRGPAAEEDAPSVAELRREVETRQLQLERVEEALKSAQAAMASGKQMTDLEIYNRIAAVVGLVPPSEPTNFSS
jgi:hypothetical protein